MKHTDRELLELAAKAAGYKVIGYAVTDHDSYRHGPSWGLIVDEVNGVWNPLDDDGDALRLAVKLKMSIDVEERTQHAWSHIVWVAPCFEPLIDDPYAATRRAIVRAAAQIAIAKAKAMAANAAGDES